MVEGVLNLASAKSVRDFLEEANENILRLENALYQIMDCKDIESAKELAADALNEDLETWLEEDNLEELDFDDDGKVPWDDIAALEEGDGVDV